MQDLTHLVLVMALVGCGTDVAAIGDGNSGGGTEDTYRTRCAGCHGAYGDGTSSAPQILNPVHGYATFVIRSGRANEMGFGGPMPSFPEGDVPDLAPIFAWLERPPHPTDGLTLFTRYCANCHGSDAQGGRVGKDITHEAREGVHELSEKVREGHGGDSYGARTKYMPSWSATELSDVDVTAITEYIASLPPGPGDHHDDDDHDGDDD